MLLRPSSVNLLHTGKFPIDHTSFPVRRLIDKNGDGISTDEFLWFVRTRLAEGLTEKSADYEILANTHDQVSYLLTLTYDGHFDKNGILEVNHGNRPYGYNIDDFSQIIPEKLLRRVKDAIGIAFPTEKSIEQ